ncbi:uncharacterized protein BP01DRAFT_396502 [Aspergillus saccharolyticus JOP 1030-1]|uniref:Uncharacterized protein n=1 Tax=Aspergillus saccharolyticus JOP 1030-1 TaxID=1450539 RepID=A0A318ZRV0_9EURO|nr:hypothetical protein BP01DRAFT_396502 [Aspergillus saccharolyticus JOP 1030-1]PYH49807.1 hypothetical protein BP01DRAFT_396502 [Aspergillus saccharolyticus JOP 1030-1]
MTISLNPSPSCSAGGIFVKSSSITSDSIEFTIPILSPPSPKLSPMGILQSIQALLPTITNMGTPDLDALPPSAITPFRYCGFKYLRITQFFLRPDVDCADWDEAVLLIQAYWKRERAENPEHYVDTSMGAVVGLGIYWRMYEEPFPHEQRPSPFEHRGKSEFHAFMSEFPGAVTAFCNQVEGRKWASSA